MQERDEPVHKVRHVFEMGRDVIADVYRLFPEPPSELRNVCHSRVVERPERVFVESAVTLAQADLNAVRQQVILPNEISVLDLLIKLGVFALDDDHEKRPGEPGLLSEFKRIAVCCVSRPRVRRLCWLPSLRERCHTQNSRAVRPVGLQ